MSYIKRDIPACWPAEAGWEGVCLREADSDAVCSGEGVCLREADSDAVCSKS